MTTMLTRLTSRRSVSVALAIFLMVLITVPVIWGAWNSWRLSAVGVETTAVVTGTDTLPPKSAHANRFFIRYHLPTDADPQHAQYTAEVDQQTYDSATATQQVPATYLPGNPGANVIDGQVSNRVMLWLVLAADLSMLGVLALALKFGERPEQQLVLLATGDVVRCKPEFAVEQDGENYVVRGDIVAIGTGEFTIHVGAGRDVRVVLGEYRNPVGHQQPAEVRGRSFRP
jgi:hypothetical protein